MTYDDYPLPYEEYPTYEEMEKLTGRALDLQAAIFGGAKYKGATTKFDNGRSGLDDGRNILEVERFEGLLLMHLGTRHALEAGSELHVITIRLDSVNPSMQKVIRRGPGTQVSEAFGVMPLNKPTYDLALKNIEDAGAHEIDGLRQSAADSIRRLFGRNR
jgi:hypothetical protein